MSPATEALVDLIDGRIGQDFDGECHLTDIEARQISAALRAMSKQIAENANCSPPPAGEE